MANIARIEVPWSGGGVVGPSMSVFHCDPTALGTVSQIRDFFVAIAAHFPNIITWSFPSSGDLVDEATGQITGTWSSSTLASVGGGNTTQPVMGVGMRVEWLTGAVYEGRRRRGRTFLVPLSDGQYDGTGMVSNDAIATVQGAAAALVAAAAGALLVWTRPTPTFDGAAHGVTGYAVPDEVTWLRSRRT